MCLTCEFRKHDREFIIVDAAIAICVDLLDNLCPDFVMLADVVAEHLRDLSGFNSAAAIFVEECKGSPHVLVVEELVLVDSGRAPFAEVDRATMVGVGVTEDFFCSFINLSRVLVWEKSAVAVDELRLLDQTITVFIPLVE